MKLSPWWTLVGTCAVIGAYWCTVRAYTTAGLTGDVWPYLAHAIGAAAAGAALCALAPLRPSREPVASAVLAIAVMAVVLIVLPRPTYSWAAARAMTPALAVVAIAAISAAGAFAGATVVRRLARSGGSASAAVLGGLVAVGLLVVAGMALHLTGLGASRATEIALMAGAAFATGYLVQRLVDADIRIALGLGVGAVLFLVALPEARARGMNAVFSLALGASIAAWLTAVAAGLARKRRY